MHIAITIAFFGASAPDGFIKMEGKMGLMRAQIRLTAYAFLYFEWEQRGLRRGSSPPTTNSLRGDASLWKPTEALREEPGEASGAWLWLNTHLLRPRAGCRADTGILASPLSPLRHFYSSKKSENVYMHQDLTQEKI